jgi:hypothetical protein
MVIWITFDLCHALLPVSIANSGTDVGQLADNVWMDTEYICKV